MAKPGLPQGKVKEPMPTMEEIPENVIYRPNHRHSALKIPKSPLTNKRLEELQTPSLSLLSSYKKPQRRRDRSRKRKKLNRSAQPHSNIYNQYKSRQLRTLQKHDRKKHIYRKFNKQAQSLA